MTDQLPPRRFIPFRKLDIADFDDVLFFHRGESLRQETLVEWWGLKKRPIRFVNYERVLVFFLTAGMPLAREELDRRVEEWLAYKYECRVNFEVDDALKKLQRFGIVQFEGDRLHCLPLDKALRRLDRIWDGFFDYHRPRGMQQ